MNRKVLVGALMVALAVAVTAGTLYASNMGFKLNYQLDAKGSNSSSTGLQTIALPDNRQTGLNNANLLMYDIGFASVENIQKFNKTSDLNAVYNGRAPTNPSANFNLSSGEAYIVKMRTSTAYIIVGSDDPALSTGLDAKGTNSSSTGLNFFAYNYHQTATNAKALMDDIGFASVENIQRFNKASDLNAVYNGRAPTSPTANFNLTPGEGYKIKMRTSTVYTPSHY